MVVCTLPPSSCLAWLAAAVNIGCSVHINSLYQTVFVHMQAPPAQDVQAICSRHCMPPGHIPDHAECMMILCSSEDIRSPFAEPRHINKNCVLSLTREMSCVLMTLLLLELNMLNAFFISSSVGFTSPTLPVAFLGFRAFFCVFAFAGIVFVA